MFDFHASRKQVLDYKLVVQSMELSTYQSGLRLKGTWTFLNSMVYKITLHFKYFKNYQSEILEYFK